MTYTVKGVSNKLEELDKRTIHFDGFVRSELGKIHDRLEKLEQGLEGLRKLVKRISESLASGKAGAPLAIAAPAGASGGEVSRDEFNKLQ